MRWLLFFHMLGATFAVGFLFFQILLAGMVKRLQGNPDEAAVIRAHLAFSRLGGFFLLFLVVTGVWMWRINDYASMGSVGWIHAKLANVLLLIGLLFGVSLPNGKKVGMGLGAPGSGRPVTDDLRAAYRKAVMAIHGAMLLVLANVVLGYWQPGH